jgi:hypothetical protein
MKVTNQDTIYWHKRDIQANQKEQNRNGSLVTDVYIDSQLIFNNGANQ